MGTGKRRSRVGRLMPDIALRAHRDDEAIGSVIANDVAAVPDSLLVLGTSLRVHGPRLLASRLAKAMSDQLGTVVYVRLSKR